VKDASGTETKGWSQTLVLFRVVHHRA